MRMEDVKEYLKREPFEPFRIHLSNGAFFDIRQPQMAHVTRSTLTIGFPVEGERQRFVMISLLHLVWLEIMLPLP